MKLSNANEKPDNSSGSTSHIEEMKEEFAHQQYNFNLPVDKPYDFIKRDIIGRITLVCSAITTPLNPTSLVSGMNTNPTF